MALEVRRSRRGTLAALVNLALAWITGIVVIGNQIVRAESSAAWIVTGVLLLLWGAMIFSGLLRPVKLVVDETGVTVVKLFGRHRFAWEELTAVDFERSEKFAVIAATVAGRARFAALAIRGLQPEALARAKALIRAKRPDLAPAAPEGAGSATTGAGATGPEMMASATTRPDALMPETVGPEEIGPVRAGPGTTGPEKIETAEGSASR